jgi:hypothetical protein
MLEFLSGKASDRKLRLRVDYLFTAEETLLRIMTSRGTTRILVVSIQFPAI